MKENESYQFQIRGFHSILALNMEKDHKMYRPARGANSKSQSEQSRPNKDHKVKLKRKRTAKTPKEKYCKKACLALCSFPGCVENSQATVLFLLVLLSQIAHLLVGLVPAMPVVHLDGVTLAAVPALSVLLQAIQGPERWKGKDWMLRRPHIIRSQLSLTETKPSQFLWDYIGGVFQNDIGKKKKFYFPLLCSSAVLVPGVPSPVAQSIMQISPLALLIVFDGTKVTDARPKLELKATGFDSYDPEKIKELSEFAEDCYWEIEVFLNWFCGNKKHIKRWQNEIVRFRPVTRKENFMTPKSDDRTEWLCAGLALFQQYLYFASEKAEWITKEEARDILLQYWKLVLPESAPRTDDSETEYGQMDYKEPDILYKFLTEYFLTTYHSQVLHGTKGTSETMALIRELDGETVFITPRKQFLETYARWLTEQHSPAFELGSEATIQRQLMEAGVPLRGEKNNPSTWRHAFYKETKDRVDCLALPITKLPEQVQAAFGNLFGPLSDVSAHTTSAEASPNSFEEVKPL